MTSRPGLADQVAAELLASIVDGRHAPGTRLPPEAVLADRAQVSRLTLREAVRVLRDKGVLTVEQGRGTFVNPPARWAALDPMLVSSRAALEGDRAQTAEQITETRCIVEVGVAELAARRRSQEHLAALRSCTERMLRAHESGDIAGFSAADVDFHDTLLAAAGNPFLAALLEPIKVLVREVRLRTSLEPEMRLAAVAAHAAILDAVDTGDEAAARHQMSEHLAEARLAVERLRALGGPPGAVTGAPDADRDVS
ncbi:FadR/GntR family transcriptional regulator [Blastococcus deserti]|uniref:FadR/GntR family transcriptional regulator n=1 Tax=Blastococcus deserti TaxID=2259033 RepID=A0ABW4X3P6_9ACTN